jgi:hypothetical protein
VLLVFPNDESVELILFRFTLQSSAKSAVDSTSQRQSEGTDPKPPQRFRVRRFLKRSNRTQSVTSRADSGLGPYLHNCYGFELPASLDWELPTYSPWEMPTDIDVDLFNKPTYGSSKAYVRSGLPVMTCEPYEHEMRPIELEGSLPDDFLRRQNIISEHSHKGIYTRQSPIVCHVPAPVPTPPAVYPRRHCTEEGPSSLPELSNREQSDTLSPISPLTPSLDTAYGSDSQQHYDVSPVNATSSLRQQFMLPLDDYTTGCCSHYGMNTPHSCSNPGLPVMTSLTQASAENPPLSFGVVLGTNQFSHRHTTMYPSSGFIPNYQDIGCDVFLPELATDSESSGDGLEDRTCNSGDAHTKSSPWHRRLVGIQEALPCRSVPATTITRSKAVRRPQRFSNLTRTQDMAETNKLVSYPTEWCGICQRSFTGRYVFPFR